MQRDVLLPNPKTARAVLIVGAIVHCLLCIPLYGRRGFPELPPFWLALIWLWVPAVVISAVFDRWGRRRLFQLLTYALVAGVTVSWADVTIVPSSKGPGRALVELIFYGPVMMGSVLVVEAVSRCILVFVRRFPSYPYCERCGYLLNALTQPRCPECGTAFPVEQLDPSYHPAATLLFKRRSTLLISLVLALGVSFPLVYHACVLRVVTRSGADAASADWASGKVKWFATKEELDAMTPEQAERFYGLSYRPDPATGFEIRHVIWQDWRHRVHETSYRKMIDRKLKESGRPAPDFKRTP